MNTQVNVFTNPSFSLNTQEQDVDLILISKISIDLTVSCWNGLINFIVLWSLFYEYFGDYALCVLHAVSRLPLYAFKNEHGFPISASTEEDLPADFFLNTLLLGQVKILTSILCVFLGL